MNAPATDHYGGDGVSRYGSSTYDVIGFREQTQPAPILGYVGLRQKAIFLEYGFRAADGTLQQPKLSDNDIHDVVLHIFR